MIFTVKIIWRKQCQHQFRRKMHAVECHATASIVFCLYRESLQFDSRLFKHFAQVHHLRRIVLLDSVFIPDPDDVQLERRITVGFDIEAEHSGQKEILQRLSRHDKFGNSGTDKAVHGFVFIAPEIETFIESLTLQCGIEIEIRVQADSISPEVIIAVNRIEFLGIFHNRALIAVKRKDKMKSCL